MRVSKLNPLLICLDENKKITPVTRLWYYGYHINTNNYHDKYISLLNGFESFVTHLQSGVINFPVTLVTRLNIIFTRFILNSYHDNYAWLSYNFIDVFTHCNDIYN